MYKNGKQNGRYVSFYENGQLEKEGIAKNDKADGRFVWYHKNGQLYVEANFKDGVTIGNYDLYNKSGDKIKNNDEFVANFREKEKRDFYKEIIIECVACSDTFLIYPDRKPVCNNCIQGFYD